VRDDVAAHVETLEEEGVTPGLATVLMSDDPASETYVSMKQRDCEEVGIESVHVEIDADAPAEELYETIDDLNEREDVHGILVQLPVPDHVDKRRVLRQIAPVKDVDGFPRRTSGGSSPATPGLNPARPTASRSCWRRTTWRPRGAPTRSSSAGRISSGSRWRTS